MSGHDLKKFGVIPVVTLDETDRRILALLQDDCKTSLARIGEAVGLTAPSVIERIRKLEEAEVIRGYHALIDGRRIGIDLTAFIGVLIDAPKQFEIFEREVGHMPDVLECHHVTGPHSLLLKVRTWNTATLEELISRLRAVPGVQRTDTMVVFSTRKESTQIPLGIEGDEPSSASPPPAKRAAKVAKRAPADDEKRTNGHQQRVTRGEP